MNQQEYLALVDPFQDGFGIFPAWCDVARRKPATQGCIFKVSRIASAVDLSWLSS